MKVRIGPGMSDNSALCTKRLEAVKPLYITTNYPGEAETNQHGNEERLVMPDDAEGEKGWRCKERVTVLK